MRKIKGKGSKTNYLIFFVIFFFVISLNFLKTGLIEISFANMGIIDYLLLLLMGFIASSAMVIPGISGSFILMVLGYYDKIIYTWTDLDVRKLECFKDNNLNYKIFYSLNELKEWIEKRRDS